MRIFPDLVRHFFTRAELEGLPAKQIDGAALDRLKAYPWPGNIRELENLIRRLTALYPQETITAAQIDAELTAADLPQNLQDVDDSDLSGAVERYLAGYFSEFPSDLPPTGLYGRVLRDVEAPLITATLAATRGNQIKAAELLGLNRNTLRKKIKDLDIQVVRGTQ